MLEGDVRVQAVKFPPVGFLLSADPPELEAVYPQNKRDFKLEELYKLLECDCIETVSFRISHELWIIILDEESKLRNKPPNPIATNLARQQRAIWPDDYIAGKALLCPARMLK